jgi:sulfur-oxidizing protein SoxY
MAEPSETASGTDRRTMLRLAGGVVMVAALPSPAVAAAWDGIRLDMPPAWETGNAVPLTVAVDSPMTATDHVRSVRIIAERNPLPEVIVFRFTPQSGKAQALTRIRLAASQTVRAVAELSDGSTRTAEAWVEITVGGCAG